MVQSCQEVLGLVLRHIPLGPLLPGNRIATSKKEFKNFLGWHPPLPYVFHGPGLCLEFTLLKARQQAENIVTYAKPQGLKVVLASSRNGLLNQPGITWSALVK